MRFSIATKWGRATALVALIMAVPGVRAQDAGTADAVPVPATIAHAEQIDLSTPANGKFRVLISAPRGDAPPQGYPVIYLLDGNSVFGSMTEAARLQEGRLGPAVIVAIGYPIDQPFDGVRRYYDLTPPTDPGNLPARMRNIRKTGGRDGFLDFLVNQVKPLVESKYRIDPRRTTLFGHSLGGQFVLHALFSKPGAFRKYVAASPSIWWNNRSLLAEQKSYLEKRRGDPGENDLLIVVGADELGYMTLDAREMARSIAPMRVYYREIAGEEHVSVLPHALNAALRFALDPR